MNREDTKKAAEVMLAFAAGERIECRDWSEKSTYPWEECFAPVWDWHSSEYRVKPKAPPIYYAVDYSLPERRSSMWVGMLHDTPEAAEASKAPTIGRVIALQEVVR